jgi:predicted mannosyl-3-phosphoglycerate phosphatase (HAD superfamily)
LIGDNDKGRAVESLTRLYRQRHPEADITTIGLGDSANDLSMLRQVDKPAVIRKKTGQWEAFNGRKDTYFSNASGPKGWAEAIERLCFRG